MRKTIFLLVLLLCLTLISCADTDLQQQFPEYYGLDTFKGLEVYVWQEDGEYLCGVMYGTNRGKEADEYDALKDNPATVEQMKEILSSYDLSDSGYTVLFLTENENGYNIEFNDKITALFKEQ